jgi:hypothetical protein
MMFWFFGKSNTSTCLHLIVSFVLLLFTAVHVVFFRIYSIDDHVDIVVDFIWCGNGVFHLLLLDSYSVGFKSRLIIFCVIQLHFLFTIWILTGVWILDFCRHLKRLKSVKSHLEYTRLWQVLSMSRGQIDHQTTVSISFCDNRTPDKYKF